MTVALSSVKVYPLEVEQSFRSNFPHIAEVKLTAAASDTTVDLATLAAADATNGPYLATLLQRADVILWAYFFEGTRNSGADVKTILSAASVGGAAAEAYTVTGLLSTDTILAVTPAVNAATRPVVKSYLSNSAAGGAAGEAYVVTGLLSTDSVIAVTPQTATANAAYIRSFGTLITNGLTVTYNTDPGAAGKVQVTVLRTTGSVDYYTPVAYGTQVTNGLTVTYGGDPGSGAKVLVTVLRAGGTANGTDYVQSGTPQAPVFTFAGGTSTPTALTLVMGVKIKKDYAPVHSPSL